MRILDILQFKTASNKGIPIAIIFEQQQTMEKFHLKKDAIQNLQGTHLKSFSIANEDLNILSGWTYIGMYLVEAKTSLNLSENYNRKEKFTEIEDITLAHGMFKNFVLSYAKCFSSSGKGKISLDSNEIFTSRQDLKVNHEKIIKTRNTYVAHNDDNEYDISIAMTFEGKNEITLAQTYTIRTPLSDYKAFRETVEYCEEQVIIKFNKKIDKIQTRFGKNIIFK